MPDEGDHVRTDGAQEEPQIARAPSPAERRAFKLLPLAWIGVLVLAVVILYLVFD